MLFPAQARNICTVKPELQDEDSCCFNRRGTPWWAAPSITSCTTARGMGRLNQCLGADGWTPSEERGGESTAAF
ncbi:hypothetical protein AV530_009823 [Patagioenas fasciata monilis]|uniref:Uncharacterized protein n=1 Tax=Patagioenas fasciata monilis TaxID=372326 RepID=A0A1V4KAE5_PATFA|nr:hypothetical protein AV530_009823 [Patagioenas fasciata monilis]